MKICKAAIVALFIIINIYCCAVWADEAAEPVLSFELEDGTQVLNQDSVIKASLIRQTDNLGNPEFMIEITFDEKGKEAFRKDRSRPGPDRQTGRRSGFHRPARSDQDHDTWPDRRRGCPGSFRPDARA